MKAKALLLFVSFACAPTVCVFGQIDCSTSTKLVCELPITSANLTPVGTSQASLAAQDASSSINASIGTQLTQLPIPSAAVGVVSLRAKGSEIGVPFENLGPILTDRPDTVGRGRLFAGFSFQHFNFNAIDGVGLGSLPVGYTFSQTTNNGDVQTYYGSISNKIGFSLNQYVGILTYGLTRTTDVSVVVPFSQVTLGVVASNFQTYLYDSRSSQYINESLPAGTAITTKGSATGVGDVTINVKQMIHGIEGSRAAVAVGGILRIPSGDSLNYLGSGAYGGNAYGLFSYRARISPHLKLAYQWNGVSPLVNVLTPTKNHLPGGLQYAGGADIRVFRPLTFAVDLLGSQFVNTPSLTNTPLVLAPVPASGGGVPTSLPAVASSKNTYTTANISTGLKWSPIPHLLLYGNVLIQINDVGLKSDPVPLAGIAYNFKTRR